MVMDTREAHALGDGSGRALRKAEPRWPMALAIITVAGLRLTLPPQLKLPGSPWLITGFTLVLLVAVMVVDPGRIDRRSTWVRALNDVLIGSISIANAWSALMLVGYILGSGQFDNAAILLRS